MQRFVVGEARGNTQALRARLTIPSDVEAERSEAETSEACGVFKWHQPRGKPTRRGEAREGVPTPFRFQTFKLSRFEYKFESLKV